MIPPMETKTPKAVRKKCNSLDGKQWIKNSISIWSDLKKTPEEVRLKHPAMFPQMLAERLIDTFLRPEGELVFDPFAGSGTTLLAAQAKNVRGVGLELSPDYVELAEARLSQQSDLGEASPDPKIHRLSAENMEDVLEKDSVDLCLTSPPYWNILNQRRSADFKETRHYGNLDGDLGTIEEYHDFLDALCNLFKKVYRVLKPTCFCCIVVMDLRKKNRFFPLHSDLATRLQQVGYKYDDLIIWNRQAEYNNLRPLGYPSVFRINKVHEYILVMQKPG